jgi:uncharacterized protein (DUF2252 family)
MSASWIIDEIARVNEGRIPKRVALKYKRMSAEVFAFFRGTDNLFARAWATGLQPPDPGPAVLQCGDLHLENFGAYAAQDGGFLFDINDFDEALIAPCGFDLTRCVCSILLAADVWKLSPVKAERIAVAFLDRYRAGVADLGDPTTTCEQPAGEGHDPISKLLGRAAAATRAELLEKETRPGKDGHPVIRRRKGLHPRLPKKERRAVIKAMKVYAATTTRPEAYKVLSVSGRIAGIGSLGVNRYLVLTEGDGQPSGYWLFDVKQSAPSQVRPFLGDQPGETWATETERVIDAQRRLVARPIAGLDMLTIHGADYRIRAMIPLENRTQLDSFQKKVHKLGHAVVMSGQITGWSHARGARFVSEHRYKELARWAEGPGLDSILATAIRHAARSRRAYGIFVQAWKHQDPRLDPNLEQVHASP